MTPDLKWYPKSWAPTIIIIVTSLAIVTGGFALQQWVDNRAEAAVVNCPTLQQIQKDTTEIKREVKFQRCALEVHLNGKDPQELLLCNEKMTK